MNPSNPIRSWLLPIGVLCLLGILALWVIPISPPYEMGDHTFFSDTHNHNTSLETGEGSLLGTGTPVAPYMRWIGIQMGGDSAHLASSLQWASIFLAWMTCALIMWVAYRHGGMLAAMFTGLFLVGNPNYMQSVFAPQSETILSTVFILLAVATTFAHKDRRWLPPLAILVALALGIDHHGAYILLALLVSVALFGRENTPTPTRGEISIAAIPISLLSAILAGIILFGLSWPWLHDHASRHLIEYITGPFEAAHPALLVRGTLWETTAPWYITLDLFFSRLPLLQSMALILGLATLIPRIWRSTVDKKDHQSSLLPFLCVFLVGITLCALNGSPYYASGTNYLGVYAPFIAIFAGLGASRLATKCLVHTTLIERKTMVMGIFVVALVGPGLLQTARSVPSHGEFIGTLEGGPFAIRQGWTSRFPGLIFHPELADWLEKHGPHHTMAFLPEFDAYRSYIEKQQKWNTLSKTIRVVRPSSADILIVPALKQHPRWTPVTHLFQSVKKQEVISIDGAPLYQIYYLNQPSQ